MHTVTIRVKNFRNLADVVVPIGHGTVIVGENKSGKSNLAHALRLVLDPTLSPLQRTLGRDDFWDGLDDGSPDWDPMSAGEEIEISVRISDIEGDSAALAALGGAVVEAEPLTAEITYRFAPRDDIEQPDEGAKKYSWGIYGADREERLGADLRHYIGHIYLDALRDAEGDLRAWRRSPLRALIEEMSEEVDKEDLDRIGEALRSANDEVSGLEAVSQLGEAISSQTDAFVGDLQSLDTTLALTPLEPTRILRELRLFVDGEAQRPLGAASLGSLNILYVALLELRLARELERKEVAHTILNIEEPEAHLHPHIQRLVFSRLLRESDGRTAIVTTHSPHIVSVTPPRQIVLLRREEENGTEVSVAAEAALPDADWADIARYLDATRGELVFAQKVLLVEGFAEQVLMPLFASHLDYDLDELGISVCAIHGTHFDVYARFLQALGIPWAVITDGDPKKEEPDVLLGEARAKRIMASLGLEEGDPTDAGIFVGAQTLEYDLYNCDDDVATACRQALSTLAASVEPDDELDAADFLRKVKPRKGRFAQRLASLNESLEAPDYVADAIERLAGS